MNTASDTRGTKSKGLITGTNNSPRKGKRMRLRQKEKYAWKLPKSDENIALQIQKPE